MLQLPALHTGDLANKKVLLRGDIDVPIVDGKVADDTRLKDSLPTIEFLFQNNASIVLCGHLGRPEGQIKPELSVKPVAQWYLERLKVLGQLQQEKIGNFDAFRISDRLTILENLRFDSREEAGDESFARELASLGQVYVNESFAESYKTTASIVGVAKLLPHFAGFRFVAEIENLTKVLESPERPLLVVIGGAKIDTKLPVIEKMASLADNVIVGGKLSLEYKSNNPKVKVLTLESSGKDVALESITSVEPLISNANIIVWNGPVGYVEDYSFQVGTRRLAELFAANQTAFKVVGGGDTVGFIDKLGLTEKFNWVSSGGGSMLKFLAGEKLPGIEALL